MTKKDPRIDAYIAKSAEFARPILAHLRALVHSTCPDAVETLKWSHPSFEYKGMLCGMASFKAHCAFGFWKHELVVGDDPKAKEAMGSFGCITQLSDLPSKAKFAGYMKKAMALNDAGVKVVRKKTRPKAPVKMHPELKGALAKNKKALATFEGFPPGQQREYLEWVADAKGDDTRARRIAQAVAWLAEGKRRNWKYEKC
ncbi:MAG: YdeI/OmpD-associated family protein [Planctomycetes bacterium]|nr:YdeI/OmpD-associated family protein [Planctomycetota bacterium]